MTADYGLCRSAKCRQRVLWITMAKSGKPNPMNPEPDADRGNVLVDDEWRGHQLSVGAAAVLRDRGEELYLSHFATCIARDQHRR